MGVSNSRSSSSVRAEKNDDEVQHEGPHTLVQSIDLHGRVPGTWLFEHEKFGTLGFEGSIPSATQLAADYVHALSGELKNAYGETCSLMSDRTNIRAELQRTARGLSQAENGGTIDSVNMYCALNTLQFSLIARFITAGVHDVELWHRARWRRGARELCST